MKNIFSTTKYWGLGLFLVLIAFAQVTTAQDVQLFVRSKAGSPDVYEVGMISSGSYTNIFFNTGQVSLRVPKAGMTFCGIKSLIGDWGGSFAGAGSVNPSTGNSPYFTTVRNATAGGSPVPYDYFIIGKTSSAVSLSVTPNTEYLLFELTACTGTCTGAMTLYQNQGLPNADPWDGLDLFLNVGQSISFNGDEKYLSNTNRGAANCTGIVTCAAGNTPPTITPTTASNTCPGTSVSLASLPNTGIKPSGTTLVWSTHKIPTSSADTLTNLNISISATYYALYFSKTGTCFSPADSVTVTINSCTTVDTDGDGVPDSVELTNGTNPNDGCSYLAASQTLATSSAWKTLDCDKDGNPNGTDAHPLTATATNDNASATVGSAATINILANDDFLPSANTTIARTGGTAGGTVSFNATTGTLNYTPLAGEANTNVTVIYQVCNTAVTPNVCATATVNITVSGITPPTCEVSYFVRTKAGTTNVFEVGMISPNSYNNIYFNTGQVTIKTPKGVGGKQFSVCNINTLIGDWGGATTATNNINPTAPANPYFTPVRNATASGSPLPDDYFIIGKTSTAFQMNVTPNTEYILFEMTGCPNSCTGSLKLYENQGTATPDAWNGLDLSLNVGQAVSFDAVERYCSNVSRGAATCTDPVVNSIRPLAINDINNTLKNTPVSGNVLTNDNANGLSPLTSIVSLAPKNGIVSLLANGSYTYSPNANFVGKDSLRYRVCSGTACDSAWVYINVLSTPSPVANNKPLASPDVAVTNTNTPVSGNVGNNDIDPDAGQGMVFSQLSSPTHGTLTFNPNGTFTYTPTTGYTGSDVFKYKVCDNGTPSLCDTASVTIKVIAPSGGTNDKPVANDDAFVTNKGVAVLASAAPNDSDPNGNALTFSSITNPLNGTVTMNTNGSFTYTPNAPFAGTDKFLYKVCDNGTPSLCDTATVTITVLPASTMPIAVNDIITTLKGSTVTGSVLTNDDTKGLTTSVTPLTPTKNGTLTLNPNGTYSYVPNLNFVGKDSVQYQLCNNLVPQECSTAWLYMNVQAPPTAANDKPTANPDVVQTLINFPVTGSVTNNDTDPEGQPLSVTVLNSPAHGSLLMNPNGTFTYTPDFGYIGTDKFTYKVCDTGTPVLCDTASVSISVLPKVTASGANDKPFAQDDAFSVTQNSSLTTASVAPNDSDPNSSQILTFSAVSNPTKGTLTMNSDGTFVYTPTIGYTGPDKFTYKVCDNGTPSLCDTATAYINVLPIVPVYVNPLTPVAINDINITPKNTTVSGNVLTNDDKKGLPVTVSVLTGAKNGTFTFGANGGYTYTPANNYVGKDSVQYQVCNNLIPPLCDQAWVYMVVTDSPNASPTNNSPVAMADVNQTIVNKAVAGKVNSNDFDSDAGQTLTFTKLSNPSNGTLVFGSSGTYTYTPNTGFVGTDVFTYKVCDNGTPSLCDQTSVTIKVTPDPTNGGNLPPVANDDAYTTMKGVAVSGNASSNDNDPNTGQTLTFASISTPSNGTVNMTSAGAFTYTPNATFVGTDKFLYKVCDNGTPSLCDTATVYISIQTPKTTNVCVTFNLNVLLQGPYDVNTGKMSTTLNQRGLLPGQTPIGLTAVATPAGQPYNTAPWNYAGTETTTTYPTTVADWILVSLRSDSLVTSTVFRAAGLLHDDGHITFLTPCFNIANGSYYLVIEHRNHMGIMSSKRVTVVSGTITYDFTTVNSYEDTNPPSYGQKLLSNGKYAMYAGDCKKNTQSNNFDINSNDSQLWKTQSGNFDRYMLGDYNFNADIANEDNTIWKANNGKFSGVLH